MQRSNTRSHLSDSGNTPDSPSSFTIGELDIESYYIQMESLKRQRDSLLKMFNSVASKFRYGSPSASFREYRRTRKANLRTESADFLQLTYDIIITASDYIAGWEDFLAKKDNSKKTNQKALKKPKRYSNPYPIKDINEHIDSLWMKVIDQTFISDEFKEIVLELHAKVSKEKAGVAKLKISRPHDDDAHVLFARREISLSKELSRSKRSVHRVESKTSSTVRQIKSLRSEELGLGADSDNRASLSMTPSVTGNLKSLHLDDDPNRNSFSGAHSINSLMSLTPTAQGGTISKTALPQLPNSVSHQQHSRSGSIASNSVPSKEDRREASKQYPPLTFRTNFKSTQGEKLKEVKTGPVIGLNLRSASNRAIARKFVHRSEPPQPNELFTIDDFLKANKDDDSTPSALQGNNQLSVVGEIMDLELNADAKMADEKRADIYARAAELDAHVQEVRNSLLSACAKPFLPSCAEDTGDRLLVLIQELQEFKKHYLEPAEQSKKAKKKPTIPQVQKEEGLFDELLTVIRDSTKKTDQLLIYLQQKLHYDLASIQLMYLYPVDMFVTWLNNERSANKQAKDNTSGVIDDSQSIRDILANEAEEIRLLGKEPLELYEKKYADICTRYTMALEFIKERPHGKTKLSLNWKSVASKEAARKVKEIDGIIKLLEWRPRSIPKIREKLSQAGKSMFSSADIQKLLSSKSMPAPSDRTTGGIMNNTGGSSSVEVTKSVFVPDAKAPQVLINSYQSSPTASPTSPTSGQAVSLRNRFSVLHVSPSSVPEVDEPDSSSRSRSSDDEANKTPPLVALNVVTSSVQKAAKDSVTSAARTPKSRDYEPSAPSISQSFHQRKGSV